MQQRTGVLSSQHIQEMMRIGAVVNGRADCINPASLDVTLSRTVYRLANVFLPLSRESMDDSLASAGATKHSLSDPLERNVPYLIQLRESIDLSRVPNVYGFCNPKSTTGRVDMHVRIITEGNSRYDTVPEGYKGSMWLLAIPRSFPISVSPGERLAQIRFFDDDTRLTETELALAINSTDGLLYDRFGKKFSFKHLYISDNDGGLILTFDKESTPGVFECRGRKRVLSFGNVGGYHLNDFFEIVPRRQNGSVALRSGSFYLLASEEFVRVPPLLACEMVSMEEKSGEFRTHYAGFIDPGWGYGKDGFGKGRPLTLEVRPFEDIVIRPGQPIAKIMFERMLTVPEFHYDSKESSHYIESRGPCLSKHFKK